MKLGAQIGIITLVAFAAIFVLSVRAENPISLWLTPDQQGRLAYENVEWANAAELFEDPMWKGIAHYSTGQYEAAAETFGRIPAAAGYYNRGNSLMKSLDYGKAINAYELAVVEQPDWPEAVENLELARYVLEYIQDTREQSDTGDESELGADEYKFDNTEERGKEMTITKQSTIELESAEKWMRTVDTETRDFLRIRFELEARLGPAE